MKNCLESLIYPKSKNEFMKSYESKSPFVTHNLKDSIKDLTELPFLKSINDLLKFWPEEVDVYSADVSDEIGATKFSTKDARKMFIENGRGLLFNDANTLSSTLQNWLDRLRMDLGLSSMTYGRNLVYATKEGKGTDTHFDQNMNFVIQIHGSKTWRIAPNQSVQNPMTRHTLGLPLDPELEAYSDSAFPENMPDNYSEFKLEPGSMLFVPRGCWHSTKASTNALSLNFTFSTPTWIDMFSTALRARLSQSPEWRETADFVSDPERSYEAAEKFNSLLETLAYEMPNWRAEDILDITEQDQF